MYTDHSPRHYTMISTSQVRKLEAFDDVRVILITVGNLWQIFQSWVYILPLIYLGSEFFNVQYITNHGHKLCTKLYFEPLTEHHVKATLSNLIRDEQCRVNSCTLTLVNSNSKGSNWSQALLYTAHTQVFTIHSNLINP